MTKIIRTYSELILLPTFEERFEYLKLDGVIGDETFGHDRYINQYLYNHTKEWKDTRREVILRDNGCDLGVPGFEIRGPIIVHHMNPITKEDILNRSEIVFDPEYLITTVLNTHNAIHYGDKRLLPLPPVERTRYDTCPWKR